MRRTRGLFARAGYLAGSSAEGRATAGSLLSGLALQGSLLITGVVAARALGVEGRGELAVLLLVPQILVVLGTLGIPAAIPYYMVRHTGQDEATVQRLRPWIAAQLVAVLLLGAMAVVLFIPPDSPGERVAAALITLSIPTAVLHLYCLAAMQGRRDYTSYNALRVAPVAIYACLICVLFAVDKATLATIAGAWSLAFFVASGLALWLIRDLLVPTTPAPTAVAAAGPSVHEMASFGLRGMLGWASPVTALRLDQLAVALFLTPAALGIFVAAQSFTNLPRFLSLAVGSIAYPAVAAETEPFEARRVAGRFVWFTTALTAAVVGVLALAVPILVPLFFGSEFDQSVGTARLLLVASLLWSINRILTEAARGLGAPGLGTLAEAISWVVLVPALVIATPTLELDGVCLALISSFAASTLVLAGGLHKRRLTPAWRIHDLLPPLSGSESSS